MALAPGWPGTEMPYSVSVPITRSTLMSAAYAAPAVTTPPTHTAAALPAHRPRVHSRRPAPRSRRGPAHPRHRYWPVLATVSIDRPASVPVLPDTRVRM